MPSKTEPVSIATTLSFLDVIANGMGSMLVLFLISAIIRPELSWSDRLAQKPDRLESKQDPFVLWITGFPNSVRPASSPIRMIRNGQTLPVAATQMEWGADFAVLILEQRPEPSTTVEVLLPIEAEDLTVQCFSPELKITSTPTNKKSDWVQIWPVKEQR